MGCLGTRMRLPAKHLRAGDFSVKMSGYRRITDVELRHETRGRGKNRATRLVGVWLHRVDGGDVAMHDKLAPNEEVLIYRHDVA